jgi:hypothetical protein
MWMIQIALLISLEKHSAWKGDRMATGTGSGEFFYVLFTMTLAGGFGGFVSALTKVDREGRPPKYSLSCPLRPLHKKDISFVGDVLIGAAAAIPLFFGIDALFGVKLDSGTPLPSWDYLRLISLGVISGYAGAGLLISLTDASTTRHKGTTKNGRRRKEGYYRTSGGGTS